MLAGTPYPAKQAYLEKSQQRQVPMRRAEQFQAE